MPLLPGLFFHMSKNCLRLCDLLLWFGFDHFAQPKAHAIKHRGHRTGRGQLVLTIPLGAQGCQRRFRRQSRLGQGGAERGGLLRVGFRQPPQGLRRLWLRRFPGSTTAEGRLRPETRDPRASLGQAHLNGMTAPPEDGFGQQRVAPTIFQGHLRLKGTPRRSSHFGGRQASIGALRRSKRRMGCQR